MTDPPRLSEPSSGAPEGVRSLFEAGARDLPDAAALERLAGRLGPVLGPGVAAPAAGGSGAAAIGKTLAVVAIIAGGAAGLTSWLTSDEQAPAATSRSESAETPSLPRAPAAALEPDPEPSSAASPEAGAAPPATPDATTPVPTAEDRKPVESEAALLERARRVLASDPARALGLTKQHQARFPNGVLVQEREVIAIEALKKLGREAQSQRRAEDFGERYPDSAHRRKLDGGSP